MSDDDVVDEELEEILYHALGDNPENLLDRRTRLDQVFYVNLYRDLEHKELVGKGLVVGFMDVVNGVLLHGQAPVTLDIDVIVGNQFYETQLGFVEFFRERLM